MSYTEQEIRSSLRISSSVPNTSLASLILKRAREPDALYFAVGLLCFVRCEPGRLLQIRLHIVLHIDCSARETIRSTALQLVTTQSSGRFKEKTNSYFGY